MTRVLTLFLAYSFRHPHFPSLQRNAYAPPSSLRERSPTNPCRSMDFAASAGDFKVPTIFGAATLDW